MIFSTYCSFNLFFPKLLSPAQNKVVKFHYPYKVFIQAWLTLVLSLRIREFSSSHVTYVNEYMNKLNHRTNIRLLSNGIE